MDLMKVACDALAQEQKNLPDFKAGDTVTVAYKIKEVSAKGEVKERIQKFRGIVLQKRGAGISKTFTVRKMSNGIGVERIFPFDSPFIDSIEVNKVGKVRRARIYYLRGLTGKKARIKEKKRGASAKVEVPVTE
ncbi:MAG: 50S ribosomal protein L19 [Bacteroidales bacterium]|nr:50S ribosomal protein L19 [Bacteroidales bacterium]